MGSPDNATYYDVYHEMSWNQAWLNASGLASAKKFSSTGLIPPAITGLHNGDALRAWSDCGIIHAVGDNTRPVLLNTVNEHWPLMSTVEENGFAGIQITPRWATNIYYNVSYWLQSNLKRANYLSSVICQTVLFSSG